MRSLLVALILAFDLTAQGWVDVTPSAPGPAGSGLCYDPTRGLTWLFDSEVLQGGVFTSVEAWSWDGIQWNLSPVPGPNAIVDRAVWDSVSQRVVVRVFDGIFPTTYSWWAWDGLSWTAFPIPPVDGQLIAFDEARSELVLVHQPSLGPLETYVFDGVAWSQRYPVIWPSQAGQSLFYDPVRTRVAMVGGGVSPFYWEWTGSNWVQAYPASLEANTGQVAPASSHVVNLSMVFDAGLGYPRALDVSGQGFGELFLTSYPAMRSGHGLVYDSGRDVFVLHGGSGFRDTWELQLGPAAVYSAFGTGCLGTGGVPSLAPQAGQVPTVGTIFTLQVNNLPLSGPAFMFFGFSNSSYNGFPLPFHLQPLGAPTCNLLVSGDLLFPIPNILGVGIWSFVVPSQPGFSFFNQIIAVDSSANSLGLIVSNGGEGVIGN